MTRPQNITGRVLSGCRIVILEDDYYQAQDCKLILEEAGAGVIGISGTLPDLETLLAQGAIDAVLVDINLGHGMSFKFVRELQDRQIPFVLLTGYDAAILPEDLAGSPYISKPAAAGRIVSALATLMGRRQD
jgi:DNA-binding response OmpR family regulator